MEGNHPVPGWNAHRHSQNPLRPPKYVMKDVPKCNKDLSGSVLQEIRNRDHFKEAMAEMALLCTEALRRSSASRDVSKPLSLEYIADRLDVDDPCFGYLVRSEEGMLQGFISLTTFTNWQKTFRWDSLHELAFYYDDSDIEDETSDTQQPKRTRRVDWDGSLAMELQNTLRFGDPYNEGIVWPRIAELSLLGAMGCGKKIVQLAIEQLEFQKPSPTAKYDYLVLQATDNSIPFYESLGFVRVGAVTTVPPPKSTRSDSPSTVASEDSAQDAEPLPPSSPDKPDGLAVPSEFVSSPLTVFEVTTPGDTPKHIATQHKVDVWDIIYLNRELYKGLTPSSRLRRGTVLHIPINPNNVDQPKEQLTPTKWFVAKENDTPRKIAKKFALPCKKVVEANQNRMPELLATSRLKEGTRIKVSNLDRFDDVSNPYCHWSFPDDTLVEGGEPSYMMAYKLNHKKPNEPREIRNSLAIPISQYSPPQLLFPPPEPEKKVILHPKAPKPPPEPKLAMDIFKEHFADTHPEIDPNTKDGEAYLDKQWDKLSQSKKDRYNVVAIESRKHYDREYLHYEAAYKRWEEQDASHKPTTIIEKGPSLFNKVVKLREDALEGHEYRYWFVLTFIPDLMWCHLAPMVPDGVFGEDRKRSQGRTRWRLVEEGLGKEMDISSMYCIPLRSKALKKTADADKEEWDILDGPGDAAPEPTTSRPIRKQPLRARSATKPLEGKLAIIKPDKSTEDDEDDSESVHSPPVRRRPGNVRVSPTKRTRASPLRWESNNKRPASSDMGPVRKARRIHKAGAHRCVLH